MKVSPTVILSTFVGHTCGISALDFSPDRPSAVFASSSEDGTIRIWDFRSSSTRNTDSKQMLSSSLCLTDPILQENQELIGTLRFNPTDGCVIYLVQGLKLLEFDLRLEKMIRVVDLQKIATINAFLQNLHSPNGQSKLVDSNNGDSIDVFDVSPCGRYLGLPLDTGHVVVCDLTALNKETYLVHDTTMSRDGQKSKKRPGNISQISTQTNRPFLLMKQQHGNICGSAVFGKKGTNVVFSGGYDSQILQHTFLDGQFQQNITLPTMYDNASTHCVNPTFITSLKLSPSQDHLGFSSGSGMIGAYRIYETRIGKSQHVYLGKKPVFCTMAHTNPVSCMDWMPRKREFQMLSVGTIDNMLQLTSFAPSPSSQAKWKLPNKPNEIAVQPDDGQFVLVGDIDGIIHLIDLIY